MLSGITYFICGIIGTFSIIYAINSNLCLIITSICEEISFCTSKGISLKLDGLSGTVIKYLPFESKNVSVIPNFLAFSRSFSEEIFLISQYCSFLYIGSPHLRNSSLKLINNDLGAKTYIFFLDNKDSATAIEEQVFPEPKP